MSNVENRVTLLEFRSEAIEKEVTTLREGQVVFGRSLLAIEKTLMQIKYAIYGGGIVIAVQVLGLKETLLKLLF